MSKLELERVIDIQKLILNLRSVKRITYNPGDGYENDVEHSFSLAFMAWLMAPHIAPHLDFYKLQTYAMIHDLVEVYAGDTFCFASKSELAEKPRRESSARRRLVREFVDFPELVEALEHYERMTDEESQFIYALDKLQPIILNYLDGGRVWQENNITLEEMFFEKLSKTAISPEIHEYVIKLVAVLEHDASLFKGYKHISTTQLVNI